MSTTANNNAQSSRHANKGNKRGGANRARGGANPPSPRKASDSTSAAAPAEVLAPSAAALKAAANATESSDSAEVCWICAEPVTYYAVSDCNHRTCHVCALRLRALYKKMECTFCKEPQSSVIFTVSPEALFQSFGPDAVPYKDAKLSINFETQEMMDETLILLRFNCPDPSCPYIASGWGDLKLHVRADHGRQMCELCIRTKKVFSHEHALYTHAQLATHLPSMTQPHRSKGGGSAKDPIEGGIHPLCAFCRECFFDPDELFAHMRERHEKCFVCERNEIRDQYFVNYNSLENHFTQAHHPCTNATCLARKFVVFNTALDLKAHMVEEHGGDMTARDMKDARRIQANFEFDSVGVGGSHGGGGGGRGRGRREREPPPPQAPPPARGVVGAGGGGGGRRREGFGASLTTESAAGPNSSPNANSGPSSRRGSPVPPAEDVDPLVAQKHAAFISRLQALASHPASAVPVVRAAVRGYKASESSARDLISTIWNTLDRGLEETASIVNALVDLLDEEEKKTDVLKAWNGFKVEQQQQFPSLTAAGPSNGAYSMIASGVVLNAKHSTGSRSARQSAGQVWDRVALAASSSRPGAFPSLPPPVVPTTGPTPVRRTVQGGQRNTPWSSSSSSGFRPPSSSAFPPPSVNSASGPTPSVVVIPRSETRNSGPSQAPPKLSNALFPELPPSGGAREKVATKGNVSLKNIIGSSAGPAAAAWGPTPSGSGDSTPNGAATPAEDGSNGVGKGKKGKGKQKQTLFTMGTFAA